MGNFLLIVYSPEHRFMSYFNKKKENALNIISSGNSRPINFQQPSNGLRHERWDVISIKKDY